MGFSISSLNPVNLIKQVPDLAGDAVGAVKDAGEAVVDFGRDEFKRLGGLKDDVREALIHPEVHLRGKGGLLDLARDPKLAPLAWKPGAPLSQAVNAHSTNTREQMLDALKSPHGYNWFEADVRFELDDNEAGKKIELRHDAMREPGSNLSMEEWLEIGKASGRGLKLDFKEGETIPRTVQKIQEAGIDDRRLMLNLGMDNMNKYGPMLRKAFPNAILAINPRSGEKGFDDRHLDEAKALAKQLGGPITFVLRNDLVSESTVKRLNNEPNWTVSIWNSPMKDLDVAQRRRQLEGWGVDGVIDLRPSLDTEGLIKGGLDKGYQFVTSKFEDLRQKLF
jgi:Uncharacterized conserved protein (DUF2181)